MGRCAYIKPDGTRCGMGTGSDDLELCWCHDPKRKKSAYRRRSKAGKATSAKRRSQKKAKAATAAEEALGTFDIRLPEGGFGSAAEVKSFMEQCMLGAARGDIGSTAVGGLTSMSKLLINQFFAAGDSEPAGTPEELKKLSNRELQAWMAERLPLHVLEAELERRKE